MPPKSREPIDPSKGKPADPRRPSTWEHKQTLKKSNKALSAAEQDAQQYMRKGGSGGGGGGGSNSGGGFCGLIALSLLSVPTAVLGGVVYVVIHLLG